MSMYMFKYSDVYDLLSLDQHMYIYIYIYIIKYGHACEHLGFSNLLGGDGQGAAYARSNEKKKVLQDYMSPGNPTHTNIK